MRTWIFLTCGDSQRKEGVRSVLRADKGIAGKGDGERIRQNSTHRLPQLKQIKLAFFLETCCYGFKTFFFFFSPPASCLSFCCRFKEIGGRCIERWRTEKNWRKQQPLSLPAPSPKSLKQAVKELLFSHAKRRLLMQPVLILVLRGRRVLLPHLTGEQAPLKLPGRVGRGTGWGTESQEQGKGSGKTTKTDREEEAGWEFKQSQPNCKAEAEHFI